MKRIVVLIWLSVFFVFSSCEKNDSKNPKNSVQNKKINSWVYDKMDTYYLWREEMPKYPNKTETPEIFFKGLLYHNTNVKYDKWSLIVPDYEEWIKELRGRSASTGANLGFFQLDKNSVVAIVYYVDKESPADRQGLKRGDAIVAVNGVTPTTANYLDLFFSEGTHEYTLAEIKEGNVIEETGVKVTVTPTEFQKDPILEHKVIERNGKKVGYLVYTSFLHEFNDALSNVFSEFKNEGIDELILDLRYNSGGAGLAAIRLASLIAPSSSAEKVFFKKTWNDKANADIDKLIQQDEEQYASLRKEVFEKLPENLNLNKVYVITTNWSASASELVISGLQSYMDVIKIGEPTHGKFTGSITINDDEKNHSWAIQPIVFKYESDKGMTEFWNGIQPDFKADDDLIHELGDENENMLNVALSHAAGVVAKKAAFVPFAFENINYENNIRLRGGILYDDKLGTLFRKQ